MRVRIWHQYKYQQLSTSLSTYLFVIVYQRYYQNLSCELQSNCSIGSIVLIWNDSLQSFHS